MELICLVGIIVVAGTFLNGGKIVDAFRDENEADVAMEKYRHVS